MRPPLNHLIVWAEDPRAAAECISEIAGRPAIRQVPPAVVSNSGVVQLPDLVRAGRFHRGRGSAPLGQVSALPLAGGRKGRPFVAHAAARSSPRPLAVVATIATRRGAPTPDSPEHGRSVPDGERCVQMIRNDGTERRVVVQAPDRRLAVPAWQPVSTRTR